MQDIIDKINELRKSNKIFYVEFVKRSTGEIRKAWGAFNIKKGLKGGLPAYDPKAHNLVWFYEMGPKGGKRKSFGLPELRKITANGETIVAPRTEANEVR